MSSLITALGGLRVHQQWLEVIGNNLANANTPGFKSSRTLFSTVFSKSIQSATPPTGSIGGRNPVQVGLGVQLAHVEKSQAQGALNQTGRVLDLAMQGNGFFAVTDGVRSLFTRVGTFGLDANRNLVDVRTGYRVLNPSGQVMEVATDEIIPPQETTNISFGGNLPAVITGPLAQVLTSDSPLEEGTAASLTGTVGGPFSIPAGETWTMDVTVGGGAPATVSVTSTTGTVTTAEVVSAINSQVSGVTAVDNGGQVEITTEKVGETATIKVTPGVLGQDLAVATGLSTSLVEGTSFAATGTTDLNDLVSNFVDYNPGDSIEVSGTDADGSPVAATFVYGTDGTTIDDFSNFVDGEFAGATVSFDPTTQEIVVAANETGESQLSLVFIDGQSQAASTNWAHHALTVSTNGAGPDEASTSVEVFDAAGVSHLMNFQFERADDGTWNMVTSVADDGGTISGDTVSGIAFDVNGALLTPPSANFQVTFPGQATQNITIAFGQAGSYDGITQLGSDTNIFVDSQDGFGVGELASIGVNPEGTIEGFYSNGQTQALGQLGVAVFSNPAGLEDLGDSFLGQTGNSGPPLLTNGTSGGAGEVVTGALEASNVDTAEQFVRLIEAQRGFQANARVISTQNDLFAEVLNII